MGLFSRRRADADYPFLTADQAEAMRDAAREALEETGHQAVVTQTHAILADGGVVGFDNLARVIADIEAHSPELRAVVGHHVAAIAEAMSGEQEPITEALIKERGYLRLLDADSVPPGMAQKLGYAERVGDRVLAVIAIDEPHTVRTVVGEDLDGIGAERARQLGYVNLLRDAAYEREVTEVDGGTVHSLAGESMFVGSRLLALGEELARLGLDATHGVIAIAPDRHHLHFHVIDDLGAVKVVNVMQNVALGAYADEAGAISPCVYWWHSGELTQLTEFADDGTVSIVVPPELANALGELSQ